MRRWAGTAVFVSAMLGMGASWAAADDPTAEEVASAAAPRAARSVGWVYRGSMLGGVYLPASERIRHVDSFLPRDRFWGTAEMVGMLQRSAETVWRRYPGARLSVGELSRRGGGNIGGHRSHESGRDADVGYYLKTSDGAPVEAPRFVRIGRSGRGLVDEQIVHFDDERNWALMEAWVTDREAPVRVVIVGPPIRRRLLRYARRSGAPRELIERAEWMMVPPERGSNHEDHFHVRIYCDPADRDVCDERGPFWRWGPETHQPTDERFELLPRFVREEMNRDGTASR